MLFQHSDILLIPRCCFSCSFFNCSRRRACPGLVGWLVGWLILARCLSRRLTARGANSTTPPSSGGTESWQTFTDNFGVPCCYNKETGSLRVDSSAPEFQALFKKDLPAADLASETGGSGSRALSQQQEALIFLTLHPELSPHFEMPLPMVVSSSPSGRRANDAVDRAAGGEEDEVQGGGGGGDITSDLLISQSQSHQPDHQQHQLHAGVSDVVSPKDGDAPPRGAGPRGAGARQAASRAAAPPAPATTRAAPALSVSFGPAPPDASTSRSPEQQRHGLMEPVEDDGDGNRGYVGGSRISSTAGAAGALPPPPTLPAPPPGTPPPHARRVVAPAPAVLPPPPPLPGPPPPPVTIPSPLNAERIPKPPAMPPPPPPPPPPGGGGGGGGGGPGGARDPEQVRRDSQIL